MIQQTRFGPPLTKAVKNLIILNAAVFAVDFLLVRIFHNELIKYYFALIPDLIINRFFIWQVFTYQFLHGDIFHILFNMFALWMFGAELEIRWGKKKFYQFYLLTGTITGIIILVFNLSMGNMRPTIGASGVVFALLLAYAVYWGNRLIYIWGLIPVKVKYYVVIMGFISFFLMVSPGESNVSHIGHLGGIFSGFICLKLLIEQPYQLRGPSLIQKYKMYKKKKQWIKKDSDNFNNMNDEQKVDEILQKISKKGIKSLTRDERRFLKETSEKMNDEKNH
ncbi:MAG: rhomboid family intramembrane serine protease [Spirochaetia bacterium]|nr:rhomboid family intramembrane serine protease [Spirochaetia bacterium]